MVLMDDTLWGFEDVEARLKDNVVSETTREGVGLG